MNISDNRPLHPMFAALIALGPACGSTSGLESVRDSDPGPAIEPWGVGSGTRTGAKDDATGPSYEEPEVAALVSLTPNGNASPQAGLRAESGEPTDGGSDALDGTLEDRTVPQRPPPRDTGAYVIIGPTAGDGGDAAVVTTLPPFPLPPGSTTYSILAAKGPRCLQLVDGSAVTDPSGLQSCSSSNGCLDQASGGGLCEDFTGPIPGSTEVGDPRQNCLQTLYDLVTTRCAATLHPVECLCGDADPTACKQGTTTPQGLIYPDYLKSYYPSTKGGDIQSNFAVSTFGAGMADAIVNCIESYASSTGIPNGCDDCLGVPEDAGPTAAHDR